MSGLSTRPATLQRVLDAIAASPGGTTVTGLARATGLDDGLVRVALHQLVTLGRLGSSTVEPGAPTAAAAGARAAPEPAARRPRRRS